MSENYQMQKFLIEKTKLILSDDAENEGKIFMFSRYIIIIQA